MNSLKTGGVLIYIILAFPCLLAAETMSVHTAIQHMLKTHPAIRAAEAEKSALFKMVETTQQGQNPEMEVGLGQKQDGVSTGLTVEATLKQPLVFSGKAEHKKAVALQDVLIQDFVIKQLKAELVHAVLIQAAQLELIGKKMTLNQKRMKKLNWIKQYINSRPFVSPQKRLELRLVESDLKSHQLEELELNAEADRCRQTLSQLVGQPVYGFLDMGTVDDYVDMKGGYDGFLRENPGLRVMALVVEKVRLETRVFTAENASRVDLFGRYASESASGRDQFLSVGLGVELPVVDKNTVMTAIQSDKQKALDLQLKQETQKKEAQWQVALSDLNRAKRVLSLYSSDWVLQMESGLDQAIDAFKKGQTDLLSVLELESQWVSAAYMQYTAQRDVINSYGEFAELSGKTSLSGDTL